MAFLSTSELGALARLREGGLVAIPTETVYGLAADACNESAVRAVFAAKGRPPRNPLIVHVSDVAMAQRYVQWNDLADSLAAQHWPGALTLVLPRREGCPIAPSVSAGGDTLALRVPAHPAAHSLIEAFDGGLAAPSANRSGRISPTCAQHVMDDFLNDDIIVLDGGFCTLGLESTVVNCTNVHPIILRHGGVQLSCQELAIATDPIDRSQLERQFIGENLLSPGMLASHYAPSLPVRLNAVSVAPNEALLAFGVPLAGAAATQNLSEGENLEEAAHNLFAMMRLLDAPHYASIAVMPIPQLGIGIAINDRLARAAAPRG